jgi:hypothetical protein
LPLPVVLSLDHFGMIKVQRDKQLRQYFSATHTSITHLAAGDTHLDDASC